MSNFVEWAKRELEFLKDGDEMNEAMYNHLVHMCQEFAKEGHSELLAGYAANLLNRLFHRLPIRPLTGEDDEWVQIGDGTWQNKRCSRVFKDADGRAYDIEGRIFRDADGVCYTSENSLVYVTFPYTPLIVVVDVGDISK